ncbi:MAG: M36 family metallopeptidase [Bacteroidetes bacterium]|nr:M36 family metallopeptidase [Bacteroidota bacterium]
MAGFHLLKTIYEKIFLLLTLFAISFCIKAQTLDNNTVMQLVSQNSESIGLKKEQVGNLKISSAYEENGIQYVYMLQTYKGLPVSNQMLVLAFKENKIISHTGTLLNDLEKQNKGSVPALTGNNAVLAAFNLAKLPVPGSVAMVGSKENGRILDFGKPTGVSEKVTAELLWIPDEKTHNLRLGWQVQLVPAGKADWWLMQVDAITGELVNKINLTVFEKPIHREFSGYAANDAKKYTGGTPPTVTSGNYTVVPYPYESPNHHAVAVENNPWLKSGAVNNATTNGWHFDGTTNYDITRGNNVHAYLDVDNNNTPNQGGNNFSAQSSTPNPSLTFNTNPDFSQDPSVTANKNAAVTNLFYWNNLIHDLAYQYGFTELAGNFQTDNLGRGGLGNDYVQAEAQDGGGSNNANFATPADGTRPRMQMYLFDAASITLCHVNTPASIAGNYNAVESGFSTANKLANVGPVTAQAVLYTDPAGGTNEACSGASTTTLTGKIAIIKRGTCAFVNKALAAQAGGAAAIIVVNNVPGAPIIMGGSDNTITIPAVMVSDVDGATMIAQAGNNLNITLSASMTQRLDGDFDNGVVSHEFTHGISNRLTGGPANSGCLNNAEEAGEGWSDYMALMMTTNWATASVTDGALARPVGTYVLGQATTGSGIRTYPYSTNMTINPWTYSGVQTSGGEVHNIGEIWCATIWDMTWNIIQQENSINPDMFNFSLANNGGNSIALKIVLEGMKLQPCSPGFLDSRNAIIQADQNLYGGRHFCAIWSAFARRGMGYSASQGSSNSTNDQTQAFNMPPVATFTAQPVSTTVCLGTPVTFTAGVTVPTGTTIKWQVSTNGGTTWADYTPANTTNTLTFTPTLAQSGNQYRVLATSACGTASSNPATLTVATATVGGSISPASVANVCNNGSGNTTTLTLSGYTGNIIRWEQSTNGGTTWTTIANTSSTYIVTNLTVTTMFRAVIQATGCTAVNSATSTLNVVSGIPPLTITANQGTVLCQGDPTLLTVLSPAPAGPCTTSSGTIAVAIPDNSATGASSSLNITCAPALAQLASVAATLNITHTWDNDLTAFLKSPNGRIINLINRRGGSGDNFVNTVISSASSTSLSTGTSPFTGTFAADASVTAAAPSGYTPTDASFAAFITNSPSVNGTWSLGIRDNAGGDVGTLTNWSLSLGYNVLSPLGAGYTFAWTPVAGLSNPATNPVAASPSASTTYTVTVSNAGGCSSTASVAITVNNRPVITAQPVSKSVCNGGSVSFNVAATGTGIAYQWQLSIDNGVTYTNLANTAPYSGVTTSTLGISAATVSMNNYRYRCVITGTCTPAATSTAAVLTVNALPNITVTPAAGCGGVAGTNGLLLTAGGGANYTWSPAAGLYTNATATIPYVAGAQTATVYAAPKTFTTYTVTGTNVVTGCMNSASALINYTPPAPDITPASVTMCLGDPAVKLTNSSASGTVKTFSSGVINVPIPDANATGIQRTITVSGIPATATVTKMNVKLNISHTWAGDLVIALKSPNNGTVNLDYALGATDNGPSATGFVNTVISSDGGASLASGTDPYTGIFKADEEPATSLPAPAPNGMTVTTTHFKDLLSPATGANGNYTLGIYDAVAGDAGTLQSWELEITYINGVPSQPAVWTPAGGLYSDPNATQPYVAGTKVDSVYAMPGATTTYSVNVNSYPGPTGSSVPVTNNLAVNNGNGLVTFNFKNNNSYPVIITDIASTFFFLGLQANTAAYYKTSPVNGAPGAISTANGWTQFGSGSVFENSGIVPFMTGLSLVIPSGATYGIAVEASDAFGTNLGYNGTTAAPGPAVTVTAGGCSIITGPGIGFGGGVAPAAPTFTPRDFIGTISFAPAGECTSPDSKVTVTVNQPIAFTLQPVNTSVCTDGVAVFKDAVTGSVPTHNWQVSTQNGNTGTWVNLVNNSIYNGVKTSTLTITNPPVSMSGYLYRDSVSAASVCMPVISSIVNLQVNPLPTIIINASPYRKLFPGLTTTLFSTVTPAAATYTWLRNGVQVTGGNAGSLLVNVDQLGDYTLKVTDVNGCTAVSNTVTIGDSSNSGIVFISPTPNSGNFDVRYYSTLNNTNLPRGLNVYDARGKRVFTKTYSIASPYQKMNVDIRNLSTGVYWVEVVDVSGNRLAVGRTEVLR